MSDAKAPSPLSLFLRLIHRLEETALVILVGSMVVLAISQIILRNFFSVSLLWAEPLIRHLVLWSGFIGALIATRENKHIKIDAILRVCSPRIGLLLNGLSLLLSAAVCLLLTWVSIRFLRDERSFATNTLLHLPAWQLQLIFPLTFGGMFLRFLHQAGRRLAAYTRARVS
jgi:TRAP-type C4-dicarboxylate transport system permease small subunit